VWRLCSVAEDPEDFWFLFASRRMCVGSCSRDKELVIVRGIGPGRRSQAGDPVGREAGLLQEGCIHDAAGAADEVSIWPKHWFMWMTEEGKIGRIKG